MSTMLAPQQSVTNPGLLPAQNQRLPQNPMLPALPQTGMYDSVYAAAQAQLAYDISTQYADFLRQLGFVNEAGEFIPGAISVGAQRQQNELQRQSDIAGRGVTEEAARGRTLFSGRHAQKMEEATYPFQSEIAQTSAKTATDLGDIYRQAAGLVDQYTLQNNMLLAEMAQRQAASIAQNPSGFVPPTPQGEETEETGGAGTPPGPENAVRAQPQPGRLPPEALLPQGQMQLSPGMFPLGQLLIAPGGGQYQQAGGEEYFQSNRGKRGKKPLY